MKKKKLNLNFNKETISNLEMQNVKGGVVSVTTPCDSKKVCGRTKEIQTCIEPCLISNAPCPSIKCTNNLCPISEDCLPPTCGPCAR